MALLDQNDARAPREHLTVDHKQLQAIGAGAPLRAVAEQVGHAERSEIHRPRVDWQREALRSFATHRTGGTPHRFSSGFFGGEGDVEERAVPEHGAGDVEVPVGDGAEGSMARQSR